MCSWKQRILCWNARASSTLCVCLLISIIKVKMCQCISASFSGEKKLIWIYFFECVKQRNRWKKLFQHQKKNVKNSLETRCCSVTVDYNENIFYHKQRWIKFLFMFQLLFNHSSIKTLARCISRELEATWNCNWLRIKIVTQTRAREGIIKNKKKHNSVLCCDLLSVFFRVVVAHINKLEAFSVVVRAIVEITVETSESDRSERGFHFIWNHRKAEIKNLRF